LLEHPGLLGLIRRSRVGLGHVEGDATIGQRLEYRIGKAREPETPFDETAGDTEALGDGIEVAAFADEVLEGAAFIGRGHVDALEVLGKRGFRQRCIIAFEHLAGHFHVLVDTTLCSEQLQRLETAAAGENGVVPAGLLQRRDTQVLQQSACLDISGKLRDVGAAGLADVAVRVTQFRKGNHLFHRHSPGCGPAKTSPDPPHPLPLPFPLQGSLCPMGHR